MRVRIRPIASFRPAGGILLGCGIGLGIFCAPDPVTATMFVWKLVVAPLLLAAIAGFLLPRIWYVSVLCVVTVFALIYVHSGVLYLSVFLGCGLGAVIYGIGVKWRPVPVFVMPLVSLAILALGIAAHHAALFVQRIESDRTVAFLIQAYPLSGGGADSLTYHLQQNIQLIHQLNLAEAKVQNVTLYPLVWLYFGLPGILALLAAGGTVFRKTPSISTCILMGIFLVGIYEPVLQWLPVVYAFWLALLVTMRDTE